jgi:excisionase family DNA binding protein
MVSNVPIQKLSIAAAADKLGVSKITIRRRIKNGELKADKVPGKNDAFEYLVQIPAGAGRIDELDVKRLIDRIEALNQEVGYYRGLYENAQAQVKLLTAPPMITPPPAPAPLPWYKRLFKLR